MKTEVILKREIFDQEISQSSKTGFFSASDLKLAGDKWRVQNGMMPFNLNQYLDSKSTLEFIEELEHKYKEKVLIKGRGRGAVTWVHPLLFIDIALAISPKLKIEVYEWIFDNLVKYRNDSGDSYREMCGALYTRYPSHRTFPEFISKAADYIRKELNVTDWETANELQLKQRDKVHEYVKLYCNVLTDVYQIIKMSLLEAKKITQ